MDLAEHGDEALVVDLLFLGGVRIAGAELFQHVVNAVEREAGMLLLLPLAEFLCNPGGGSFIANPANGLDHVVSVKHAVIDAGISTALSNILL